MQSWAQDTDRRAFLYLPNISSNTVVSEDVSFGFERTGVDVDAGVIADVLSVWLGVDR